MSCQFLHLGGVMREIVLLFIPFNGTANTHLFLGVVAAIFLLQSWFASSITQSLISFADHFLIEIVLWLATPSFERFKTSLQSFSSMNASPKIFFRENKFLPHSRKDACNISIARSTNKW